MKDHIFKKLSKEAKLIYWILQTHCITADVIQEDELDIANGIGLERRLSLDPFGNVVIIGLKQLKDSGFIALLDYDFIYKMSAWQATSKW